MQPGELVSVNNILNLRKVILKYYYWQWHLVCYIESEEVAKQLIMSEQGSAIEGANTMFFVGTEVNCTALNNT